MSEVQVRHVPYEGGEKESLHVALDRHRDVVVWKLEGLDEERARRALTPSGTSLLGLVKHLASVEYSWFCTTFGRESEPLWFDPYESEDMAPADDETIDSLLAFYARARAAADRSIAELPLEAVGTAWDGRKVSMRWVLVHMLEETARHAGHMDILRELTDEVTGCFP
ncbi:DinB family protein [Streptomyces beihaiensis]|uniref:DinB family protein n=1 Tax=Streptomyces beihaiensis TaxID=2984495 RepID=A0ABT3TUI2_9ACTN|nr:DinB family protein [Streptomyces beihaiensis]MCX3060087.1 DinB family protein [Streptomyces beihaiensis]